MKKNEVKKMFQDEIFSLSQYITKLEKDNKILRKQSSEINHLKTNNETLMQDNHRLRNEAEKINERLAMKEMEFQITKKRIDEFNEYFILKDMTYNNSSKLNKSKSGNQGWKI